MDNQPWQRKEVIGDGMILQGHVLEQLVTLADESVHCVVTSPPYWGLRDYNLPPQVWDDLGGCEHEWEEYNQIIQGGHSGGIESSGIFIKEQAEKRAKDTGSKVLSISSFCRKCNAWRGSLGLEPTLELYLQHMVEVFQEVRRVMRPDATCWLNMGDSYATGTGGDRNIAGDGRDEPGKARRRAQVPGLKPKDLCGIPWRLALALQTDGWWLRSDIIWAKPNPMPESVTDRPTRSHEYIFLLTKAARYYYDAEAVREKAQDWGTRDRADGKYHNPGTGLQPHSGLEDGNFALSGRNLRSVWNIATQPFPDAHFATFPEKLVRRCIMAGCPKDGLVLDPFVGSGTVGKVAQSLGRDWIGIELNTDYCEVARKRIDQAGRQGKLFEPQPQPKQLAI